MNLELEVEMRKPKLFGLLIVIMILSAIGIFTWKTEPNTITISYQSPGTSVQTKPIVKKPTFDKKLYSNVDPSSIWVIVNKSHPLSPLSYVPTDLVTPNIPLRSPGSNASTVASVTAKALGDLFDGAKLDNLSLMLTSGYRSYNYQTTVYNGYLKSMGQVETDKVSARPGYSEHQTGFAADLEPTSFKCELDACFATTPEGIWLAANAYKYGFIIRYPSDKTAITGYSFEPWHVRYVGVPLATEMHNQGIETLEEFFNISGGTNY